MRKPTLAIILSALALGYGQSPSLAEEKSSETKVKTVIKDASWKKRLMGRHMLSLQWISWEKFGSATVSEKDGTLFIKGEQVSKDKKNDYLKIDGIITEVSPKQFKFRGKVLTRVSFINDGKECVRDGDLTFAVKGNRKYFRMKEMDNPCDTATDYVDVYFK